MSTDLNVQVGCHGNEYILPPGSKELFLEQGYVVLPNFLSESELQPLDEIATRFFNREIEVPGKDFCDMSAGFDRSPEQFSIVNAMLPRVYYPALQNNVYEQRAASVARQLYADVEMKLDYDQLLNKQPFKTDAVFAWHQDMAYWPMVKDTRTATFSLAIDTTTEENGCLNFVPGSHISKIIRSHKPIGKTRDDAHAIAIDLDESKEQVDAVPIPRGSVSVHNEYVIHGSKGNRSSGTRRTYVVAFRTADTVQRERAAGFTHSHNDTVNWDTFNAWQDSEGLQRTHTI
jgi:phytanoyl-CoA hydroxylase